MIFLGKIVRVRGNKGEVVCTTRPGTLLPFSLRGETILLQSAKYQKEYKVEQIREIKGSYTLKLESIDTINQALPLVGYSIFRLPGEAGLSAKHSGQSSRLNKTPSKGAASDQEIVDIDELIGYQVEDIEGHPWGVVTSVEEAGINTLLVVEKDQEILYVPWDETIITDIREKDRLVIIDPPEGLKELND